MLEQIDSLRLGHGCVVLVAGFQIFDRGARANGIVISLISLFVTEEEEDEEEEEFEDLDGIDEEGALTTQQASHSCC